MRSEAVVLIVALLAILAFAVWSRGGESKVPAFSITVVRQ